MRAFLYRQSLVLFLAVFLVRGILMALVVKVVEVINPALSVQKDLGWLVMVIYSLCAYLAVKWVRIDKEIGLLSPSSVKEFFVWFPGLLLVFPLVLHIGFHSTWSHVPFLIIAAIGVAVNEEILFRGILLRGFLRFGRTVAIIIPSILFGASHLGNILVGGDVSYALFQFAWASIGGMALTAMRLQSKSLLPAIFFHMILDGMEYAATGEYGVHSIHFSTFWLSINVLVNIMFLVYALMTLKQVNTNISLGSAVKA